MPTLTQLQQELTSLANPKKAKDLSWFFKTGKGEYGEGERFLGITVPRQRQVAKKYIHISLTDIEKLLKSPFHEYRLTALMILVEKFKKSEDFEKKKIFDFYLAHTDRINNWDLVDCSARHIMGGYLSNKPHTILLKLAGSKNIWERRIAVISTLHFICEGRHEEIFLVAEKLLKDKEDLIHKAVGWMLREVGKRCSEEIEESFLKKHYKIMPRTMLRYAIERFPEEKRLKYLHGEISNL